MKLVCYVNVTVATLVGRSRSR